MHRKGSRVERTQRNKRITDTGFEPRSSACRADAQPSKLRNQPAEHEF